MLVLLRYYLPGYKAGGPLRTIENTVDCLGDEFDFRIVTSDRDLGEHQPYSQIAVDRWNALGKSHVYYASPALQSLRGLASVIRATPHDLVYLNSYFDPVFSLRPLLARRLHLIPARPTVLAPRGEFSHGALMLKRFKKTVYRAAASLTRLDRSLIWQASSDYEAEDIQRFIGSRARAPSIVVAPDLPAVPTAVMRDGIGPPARAHGDPLRICFVSRVSPKKNLDFALRVLRKVKSKVIFDIYGPLEDPGYWMECKAMIADMPRNIAVRYHGGVEHERVWEVFRSHDLFLFPTRGENFGHVILESMSAGTPVLLSDTTPWRHLEGIGVGWDLSLENYEGFVTAIETAAVKDAASYVEWRRHVRTYALDRTVDVDVLSANRTLFLNLVAPLAVARR